MSTEPVLHIDCVSHSYPDGTMGIHKLCLRVFPKEIVAICGPNGAGKSTLLEHLNGILIPSDGRIVLEGEAIDKGNISKLRKTVGLVFQDADSQLFAPTVIDDVMFGPLNFGLTPTKAKEIAEWALNMVGFSEKSKIPHYLSGGEKRLVAIAGIVAMKPKVIAVDEPTADLDPVNADNVENLLRRLNHELGLSIVISTHDMDLAARIADRLYIIRKGSVLAEGLPKDIFYNEELLKEARLQPPKVASIYLELAKEGIVSGDEKPLTQNELIEIIKERRR